MLVIGVVYMYYIYRRMNLSSIDVFLWTAQTLALGFTSLLPLKAKYKQLMKED